MGEAYTASLHVPKAGPLPVFLTVQLAGIVWPIVAEDGAVTEPAWTCRLGRLAGRATETGSATVALAVLVTACVPPSLATIRTFSEPSSPVFGMVTVSDCV